MTKIAKLGLARTVPGSEFPETYRLRKVRIGVVQVLEGELSSLGSLLESSDC